MQKLKQLLAQKDSLLFIGSGISTWSGLPSWPCLIEELAQFVELEGSPADLVRAEAKRGDLLQAASYGFDKLTKQQIGKFIRDACRYGVAKPHEIHRKIVSLGARCFVTTNYDNLIELALGKWQPDRFFRPPITNRHLTETADIVHARAIDFVFKPHGDAADSDSIILTREQYRQLLPHGERQSALESLKMLLATRPVVYLGFSLRDPDFIYVRDILTNIYKGGALDHYALMADVSEAERDYWRRNYSIHLVGYTTTPRPDCGRDHSALLTMLDSLLEPLPVVLLAGAESTSSGSCAPDIVLSLARHAARLTRTPKVNPAFSIRVSAEPTTRRPTAFFHRPDSFDNWPVDKFLDNGPERALLVGLPGAGKTYALRQAAGRLAESLHEACLSETFDETAVVVPILVDLKLYQGDLAELVNHSLPQSLPFQEIMRRLKVKIFLDSFNEMPREYRENGVYEGDFCTFAANIGTSSLVIGSRTSDGLNKLEFPTYCLDQLDSDVVEAELQKMSIDIPFHFDREIRQLLEKPFFFQLVASGAASLQKDAHPRDLFQSYFINLQRAFATRFGQIFDIEEALSLAAYDAINRGEEAYPLADLLHVLNESIRGTGCRGIDSLDVANWLVSVFTLLPHVGSRISFVHQSVTEYLAAKQLARLYTANPRVIRDKMTITRWDQALFIAFSFLPDQQSDLFFNDMVNVDLVLALSAVKYLEVGRDEVVSNLLERIAERTARANPLDFDLEAKIGWLIESAVPLSKSHEPLLRVLMTRRNIIGGAAAKRLVVMKGAGVKDEMYRELLDARSDYNYCVNGIASALRRLATPEDIDKIRELASLVGEVTSDVDEGGTLGFIAGAAEILKDLKIETIRDKFFPIGQLGPAPESCARMLCEILRDRHSTEALHLAGELLLRRVKEAATSIYFITHFAKPELAISWTSFGNEHLDHLISMLDDPEDRTWGATRALRCICSQRPDLAEITIERASRRLGIVKACLLYCASREKSAEMFEALSELVYMSPEQLRQQPTHLMESLELNWAGHEELLSQILKLRNARLACGIVYHMRGNNWPLGQVDIGPIEWWLDWLMTESDHEASVDLHEIMPEMLMTWGHEEMHHNVLVEFNKAGTRYRSVLADTFLCHHKNLTTDDFTSDAVSFLLADLKRVRNIPWRGHILGLTATEQFVEERILPLLPEAKDPLLTNLKRVVRQAGSRHGRRYIFE